MGLYNYIITDYTVDNIESQLEEFVNNGEVTRDGRVLEVYYPSPDVHATCEPTGETNDVGAEIFKMTVKYNGVIEEEKQANPDIITTFIHNVLNKNVDSL